jgi:hypothetical protein
LLFVYQRTNKDASNQKTNRDASNQKTNRDASNLSDTDFPPVFQENIYRSPQGEVPVPKVIHVKTPPVNLFRTYNSPPTYKSASDKNSPIFYRCDLDPTQHEVYQEEYYPSNFEISANGRRYSKEVPSFAVYSAGSPSAPFEFCMNETRNPQQIYRGAVYRSTYRN